VHERTVHERTVLAPAARQRAAARWRGHGRALLAAHGEAAALFVLAAAGYILVAAIVIFHEGAQPDDAISRLNDASNVVFSNDPHLAAVGFVWNPLPSLVEIPLLLLKGVWPALLARGLDAGIMSSLFMAGAVVGVRGILADRGAGPVARVGVAVLFGAVPMIVLYGGNGMSEAFFVFFLIWTTRSLLRYVATRRAGDLVSAGIYLALAYLTRYEAAAAALGVAAAVVVLNLDRSGLRRGEQGRVARRGVVLELLLGVGPFAVSFLGWAGLSAIIVGSPFEQFSSAYGNSNQIGANRTGIQAVTGQGSARAFGYAGRQMFALEPLLAVVLVAAVLVAWRRRSWLPLIPLAVFGPVLAFAFLAFLAGDTFGWLRFYIMEIPLAVATVAVLVPVGRLAPGLSVDAAMAAGMRRAVAAMLAVAVLAPALYTSFHVFGNATLAREEFANVHEPLRGDRTLAHEVAADQAVARYLDGLHVGRGLILTEASDSVEVADDVDRQNIFLATSDVHFPRDLADPVRFGIRYILVARPGLSFDAVDNAYPQLWATGGGFGPRVASFPASPQDYRLYRITATATPGAVG
jgi:hypothetical protein